MKLGDLESGLINFYQIQAITLILIDIAPSFYLSFLFAHCRNVFRDSKYMLIKPRYYATFIKFDSSD